MRKRDEINAAALEKGGRRRASRSAANAAGAARLSTSPAHKAICLLTSAALIATMGFGTALAANGDNGVESVQSSTVAAFSAGAQVGDKVWIKKGSVVYKSINGSEKHELVGNYEIEIKEIAGGDAGNPLWYKFDYVGQGILQLGQVVIGDYCYVKAESTSATEPVDGTSSDDPDNGGGSTISTAPACTCGENAPEDLAEHADSCARKQYVKGLITGENGGYKTAEQIYASWASYDASTRTDVLSMVKACAPTSYDELCALVAGNEGDGFDVKYEDYAGGTADGVGTSVSAPEGAFPEGTTMSVASTDVSSYKDAIKTLVGIGSDGEGSDEESDGSKITGMKALDISFAADGKKVQPGSNVVVTMSIPAGEKALDGANMVYIVHIGDAGPELVTFQYLSTASEGQSITFGASSFSSYAAVFVNGKYNSEKMIDVLANSNRYSIATFDVDLFDYDPANMNAALKKVAVKSKTESAKGEAFLFRGYKGQSDITGTSGINDSTAEYAKQGVVKSSLGETGFPVFNYIGGEGDEETSSVANASLGKETGETLFGTEEINGKTVHEDSKFQFVYDKDTGYYSYKSSANHAQYNEDTKTVELYADTLSTQNKYASTLDFTAYYDANDGQLSASYGCWKDGSITAGNGTWKGTAKKGEKASRLDPYVTFKVPAQSSTIAGQPATSCNKIYVKAKIPAAVGKNMFQVFFTTDSDEKCKCTKDGKDGSAICECKSFTQEYTANGNYIEFVIDTSGNDYWKGNITNLRIDLFDANKGTLDDDKEYEVEIAQISLIEDYDNYVTRGGFYPFSEIEDSYPGNGTGFNFESWEENMGDDNDETKFKLSSRSIFNPDDEGKTSSADSQDLTDNLFFGAAMEFDFYIPVGGKVNDQNLKYTFTGDDDLWVFVDGKLVLDIGGGHGAITGTVDFTEGKSTVLNATKVTGYNTTETETETVTGEDGTTTSEETTVLTGEKTTSLDEALKSPGKHTMKIFYMERCGSVSNCFMKFNLPMVPQGDIVVSKSVEDEAGSSIDALKTETFDFSISGTYQSSNGGSLDTSGLKYKLFDTATGDIEEKTVGLNGSFSLTATQTATFSVNENCSIVITETTPSSEVKSGWKYVGTKVNGTEFAAASNGGIKSEFWVTTKGGSHTFAFTNVYELAYGDLKVGKSGIDYRDDNEDTLQSTVFRVTGTSDSGVPVDVEITIVGNDSKIIRQLPVGTYTVTEVTDWSWRYEVSSSSGGVTSGDGGSGSAEVKVTVSDSGSLPTVTFVNERNDNKWLSGDCFCRNWWNGNGGISEDHAFKGAGSDDAATSR